MACSLLGIHWQLPSATTLHRHYLGIEFYFNTSIPRIKFIEGDREDRTSQKYSGPNIALYPE